MADKIAANLVLNTSLRAPRGTGLSRVKSELESIRDIMNQINQQDLTINVRLNGGQQALSTLNQISIVAANQLARQQAAQARQASRQAGGGGIPNNPNNTNPPRTPRGWGNFPGAGVGGSGSGGGGSSGNNPPPNLPQPPPQRRPVGSVTDVHTDINNAGGITENVTSQGRQGVMGLKTITTHQTDPTTGNTELINTGTSSSNDARKAELQRQKTEALRPQINSYRDQDQDATFQQRSAMLDQHERDAQAVGLRTERSLGKAVPNKSGTGELQHEELEMVRTLANGREEFKRYSTSTGELSKTQERQTEASKLYDREQRRAAKTLQHSSNIDENKNRGDRVAQNLTSRGFTESPRDNTHVPVDPNNPAGSERTTSKRTFERTIGNVTEVFKYDEALGKVTETSKRTASAIRDIARSEREAAQVRQINDNIVQSEIQHQRLLAEGYRITNTQTKQLTIGTQQLSVATREYQRSSGNPILGNLSLDVAKLDQRTNSLTQTNLQGSNAMRKLGDSFSNAVSKISTWFAATTAIFLFARASREVVTQFQDLEANTVFLARVGQKLGDGFQSRLAEAKLLTTGIAELSAVTGISATESQKASAVFLRAGQNRIETLQSTKVAMLAASIAELDVEQAAKLLSSAQKQFNIEAKDSMGVLDTLNSLSNKYVVSTNDLLQAISRGGKIYAQSGGQLESLAATVAILSDKTQRSGAEIGNALKTIQTRLATSDVSKQLGEKLGLSLYDEASGKAKSFGTVLLQLEAAMVGLSDRERDQIGITIAGARQYNLLKNALDGVAEIAIAEAAALRESGSATAEAIERSRTLEAAIGRLQGTFSQLIDGAGKSAGGVITSFANLLSLILQLATACDGAGIKLAAFTLVLGGIYLVVSRYGTAIAGAALGTVRFATTLGLLGTAANATTVSLGSLLAMARILQTALISLGIGAALMAIFYAVNHITESLVTAQLAENAMSEAGDKQIETLTRQRKATTGLTDVLKQKIETQRKLNAMGDKAPQRDVNKNKKDIELLTENLELKNPVDLSESSLAKLDAERLAAKNKSIQDLKSAYDKQVEVEKDGLRELEKTRKEYGSETSEDVKKKLKRLETDPVFPQTPEAYELRASQIKAAREQLIELLKIEGEIAAARLKIKEAQAKSYEAGNIPLESSFDPAAKKAWDNSQKTLEQIKKRKADKEYGDAFGGGSAVTSVVSDTQAMALAQASLIADFHKLPIGSEQYEELKKKIIEATEALEKLNFQQYKAIYSEHKKQVDRVIAPINEINASLISSRSKIDFARTEGKGQGGAKFEGYNSIKADNDAQVQIARASATRIKQIQANKSEKTGQSVYELAEIDTQREAIAKALENARKGEVSAANELLKIELDITKERVQQNKEAAKAAGLLSDEDKVKLLSQAEYFRQNPNKEINAKDAFFADADSNRLGQQFFGSKYNFDQEDKLGGTNQGFRNMFGADFGVSRETKIAEDELKKHGLGPNATEEERRKFADENKRSIQDRSKEQAPLTGEFNENTYVDIGNPFNAEDMKPLVDAFNQAVNTEILKMEEKLIQYIKDVWKPVKSAGIEHSGDLPPTSN